MSTASADLLAFTDDPWELTLGFSRHFDNLKREPNIVQCHDLNTCQTPWMVTPTTSFVCIIT